MNDEQSTTDRRNSASTPVADGLRASGTSLVRFADFEFDWRRDELRRAGAPIALRPKPHALLRHFLEHPQRLISKQDLMSSLWGTLVVTDDSLVQCVGELRAKLGDHDQKLIRTLPRRGYMFDVEVRPADEAISGTPPPASARTRPGKRWLLVSGLALTLALAGGAAIYIGTASPRFSIDSEVAQRHVIALLPFADIGNVPAPRTLSEGLVDELAAQLASLRGVVVIRGPSTPKTRYILTGNVARKGEGASIDAQLASVDNGAVIWSEHFDYADATDSMVKVDVALRLVSSIRLGFSELHKKRVAAPGHRFDPADLVLSGWEDIVSRRTMEDVRRGRARFEEALRADPDSVIALTGLAAALMSERFGYSGEPPPKDVAESERAAARSLEIAPNDTVSLINWGNVLLFRGEPDLAEPMFAKAVLRAPANPNAYVRHAFSLMLVGRAAEMQPRLDSAMRLGYRDQRIMAAAYYVSAESAFAMGDEDKAYTLARRSLAERPTYGLAYAMLAAIDALKGREEPAASNMREHLKLMPHNSIARFEVNNPAGDPGYLARRNRMIEGLRAAGLPAK